MSAGEVFPWKYIALKTNFFENAEDVNVKWLLLFSLCFRQFVAVD